MSTIIGFLRFGGASAGVDFRDTSVEVSSAASAAGILGGSMGISIKKKLKLENRT